MTYMCTPSANGVGTAVAVPLANVTWSATFKVQAGAGLNGWAVAQGSHSLSQPFNPKFDYEYPEWTGTMTNTINPVAFFSSGRNQINCDVACRQSGK